MRIVAFVAWLKRRPSHRAIPRAAGGVPAGEGPAAIPAI
jgi:hypothetical protein